MVLSLKRFEDKVAVVTGASAGIGAAIAEELVKNGVIVRINVFIFNLGLQKIILGGRTGTQS